MEPDIKQVLDAVIQVVDQVSDHLVAEELNQDDLIFEIDKGWDD
jgi:hypothetical protein